MIWPLPYKIAVVIDDQSGRFEETHYDTEEGARALCFGIFRMAPTKSTLEIRVSRWRKFRDDTEAREELLALWKKFPDPTTPSNQKKA